MKRGGLMALALAASLVTAATLLGVSSTLAAAASTPVMAKQEVEKKILALAKKTIDNPTLSLKVKSVKCPHDLKGKVGTTMVCSLTESQYSYQTLKVQAIVTVTKVRGKTINFTVHVNE